VVIDATLVTIHGFWSSPATWERLNSVWRADEELDGLRIHPFGYSSPRKTRLPLSATRVPDYNDVAQTLATEYTAVLGGVSDIAIVTHSQGGLILQRFLAWMVSEGRARELSRIRSVIMLACPNGGSEYLESLRRALGYRRHPQAGSLQVLDRQVADTQRIVLRTIVNAVTIDDHQCHIPFHVYAGSSDEIVKAASAQAAFPGASTIAGNHFMILDPASPGNHTAEIVKHHLLADIAAARVQPGVVAVADEAASPAVGSRTGTGKYLVDVDGVQGLQIGDHNSQHNVIMSPSSLGTLTTARQPRIWPGQPRNEAAFGPVYEAAGGVAFLGEALGEVYEEGPGFVQHFSGGPDGEPAVICAVYEHTPVAVAQQIWNALRAVGRGANGGGTPGVGFPAADQNGRPAFIVAESGTIELTGGTWGPGQLIQTDPRWQWRPHVRFDSQAYQDQDTWSMRREEMDLRLRVAARFPFQAEDLRITSAGRSRMLAALPATRLIGIIARLAARYGLESGELNWQETPEPVGYNDTLRAAYQLTITGPDGRAALHAALWCTLPHQYEPARAIVDLSIDFDAIRPDNPGTTPSDIPADLKVAPSELIAFLSSAWQAAMMLPLAGTEDVMELPPAGPPRLEFYIQNRRPENSGRQRTLRTLDMIDLSVFGHTRRAQISDLAVGITAPLGLSAEETDVLARKAINRMAEDYAFTNADAAEI
jgi:Alpha/beta hydrolase family